MKKIILIFAYFLLGTYATITGPCLEFAPPCEWEQAYKSQPWELESSSVTVSGGAVCKLKSPNYSIELEGSRGPSDDFVRVDARLHRSDSKGDRLLAKTEVLPNSDLEKFLTLVMNKEMDATYNTHLEQLFRFEGARRFVIFLHDRDMPYSIEARKLE